jgi:phosphoglycolate phosphatase-like HAD superfamily hydrolase
MTRGILVLWDIDRTLLYAGDVDQQVYREVYTDLLGERPAKLPARGTGVTTPTTLRQFFFGNGVTSTRIEDLTRTAAHLLPEYLLQRRALLREQGMVMPGAVEALRAVSNDPRFVSTVVTGNLMPIARIKLETFGLHTYLDLDVAASASDDSHRPRLVGIAQERATARYSTQFTNGNTVSVGDSLEDVRTARLGGCRLAAVASGTTPAAQLQRAGANVVLHDLTDTAHVVTTLVELGARRPRGPGVAGHRDPGNALNGKQ